MIINYEMKAIELTKAEAKMAKNYASEMYKKVKAARSDYPDFEVKVREVKTTKRKTEYKG